jgi:hypothetical protein
MNQKEEQANVRNSKGVCIAQSLVPNKQTHSSIVTHQKL